jgi:hypothetical protein
LLLAVVVLITSSNRNTEAMMVVWDCEARSAGRRVKKAMLIEARSMAPLRLLLPSKTHTTLNPQNLLLTQQHHHKEPLACSLLLRLVFWPAILRLWCATHSVHLRASPAHRTAGVAGVMETAGMAMNLAPIVAPS